MSEINEKTMGTPDLNEERLETLKGLFPDLFTVEGKLNPDELKKIIDPDLVKETERFEFKWFGKSEAKRTAFTPSKATLVYDEERSVNPELTNGNMIIEGENLETLKCLLSAYRERIKCIYIDPPYNKRKDFVYSDKWDENNEDYWEHIGVTNNGIRIDSNIESDGRFHSNWLNLIYSRLLLSRQLLTPDGVIFISIDDSEFHNLRKLTDEVFGEYNLLAQFTWRTDGNFDNQAKFKKCHEYIMVYAKDSDKFPAPPVIDPNVTGNSKLSLDFIRNTIVKNGPKNPVSSVILNPGFPCEIANGKIEKRDSAWPHYMEEAIIKENKLMNSVSVKSGWSSKELLESFIDSNYEPVLDSKRQETTFVISQTGAIEAVKKRDSDQSHVITVLSNFGGPQKASKELENNNVVFDGYPKPVELIKYLLNMNYGNDYTVLDFFAGSGTTGQAAIELNKTDNGKRNFILIQIPEITNEQSEARKAGFNKISDITITRNKNVIRNIEKQQAESDPSLFDEENKPFKTGFKVYKLSKSNFPRVDFTPDPEKTEEENLELLNKYIDEKEGMFLSMIDETLVFDEVLLKNGFMLNYSKIKEDTFPKNAVFKVKDKFKECLICLDMSISKETLKELEGSKDSLFICLERALDTTMKWNLKHLLGDKLVAV